MKKWKYYNHAVIPTTAPHCNPYLLPIENGSIWKMGGGSLKTLPILARWITEFDCGFETNWWYVIKDDIFDVSKLKAKRRYEINKGIKNFEVKIINPEKYKERLYEVQIAAFSAYPKKYRPRVNKESFFHDIDNWNKIYNVFGAFYKETDELCGYALLTNPNHNYVDFSVLKTKPNYEKLSVNASLLTEILCHYHDLLMNGGYICDGSRSINHETKFQDYLEKYFGFRKAYCHLHIQYNPKIKWLVELFFHLRKILNLFDGIGFVHQINSILKMEEICRSDISDKKVKINE